MPSIADLEAERAHQWEHIWCKFSCNVLAAFRCFVVGEYRKLAILLIVPWYLFGCIKPSEDPKATAYTPNGYGVIAPSSWSRDPFTQEEVLGWVDLRIAEWIDSRKDEYGVDYVTAVSYGHTYELIDDSRFIVWPGAITVYANGQWIESISVVRACLYTNSESVTEPETVPYNDMGPWYVRGIWKWGVFPADGIGFTVIPHELDHAIGIDH